MAGVAGRREDVMWPGSGHLPLLACATPMHDNGADIRLISRRVQTRSRKLETTAIHTKARIHQLQDVTSEPIRAVRK